MYSSQEWFSNTEAGGGGPVDPGDPILGSLRFSNAQVLTRAPRSGGLNGKTWCASFWVKLGDVDKSEGCIFVVGDASPENWILSHLGATGFANRTSGGNYTPWNTGRTYKDPAAWYHIYAEGVSNIVNLWINGVKAQNPIGMGGMDKSINLGNETNTNSGQNFDGYIAQFFLIDGELLGWDTFARYNVNGVIVPVEPTITNWGDNGAYLKFEDPNDFGLDSSPNADNWTPKGFVVDPTSPNYGLSADSPTQNYATFNPLTLTEPGRADIKNANLSIDSTSNGGWFLSQTQLSQDHFYFEMTLTAAATAGANSGTQVGIVRDFLNSGPERLRWITTDVLSVFGTETPNWSGTTWGAAGDVLGLEYDRANTLVRFFLNGTLQGTVTDPGLADGNFVPLIQNSSSTGSSFLAFNFGQQPFRHRPAGLDDTNNLQTQNMSDAPIANGRDHFQAITGPGSGANAAAGTIIGAFSTTWSASGDGFGSQPPANAFSSDTTAALNNNASSQVVTWDTSSFNLVGELSINMRGSGYRLLIDGVEAVVLTTPDGQGDNKDYTFTVNNPQSLVWDPDPNGGNGIYIYNFSLDGDDLRDGNILAIAQQTFPQGLWWIKDRANSNQHQLVDSVRGGNLASQCPSSLKNQTYAPPAGDSVAWCWNAADPATSGFNIIEFTGDANATQAVAHGLPGTPEFIISMSQSLNTGMQTFHVGCAAGQSLSIDSSGGQATSNRYSGVDATNITYGGNYNTNGELMIAYAWTSVPGYSAFGSYQGNGNADGPFVYTGFRPAFVMVKWTASGDWVINDSTRDVDNPTESYLIPNITGAERTGADAQMDLLSNGFKIRNSTSEINNSNSAQRYIYAAFAENPFSSPVTAR